MARDPFVVMELQALDEEDAARAEWRAFSTITAVRGRSARRAVFLRTPTDGEMAAVRLALKSWNGTAYILAPVPGAGQVA